MNLDELRVEIDKIDKDLVELFAKRMDVAADIAAYKKENGLPVLDATREREKINALMELAPDQFEEHIHSLYSLIFELSRSYQSKRNNELSSLPQTITQSIENTPKLFPQNPIVACQGVEGAYSQIACEKIFKSPFIMYFKSFDGVFNVRKKQYDIRFD